MDIIKASGFYKSLIGWSKSPVIPKIIAWKKALSDLSAWQGAANADNGRSPPTGPPFCWGPSSDGLNPFKDVHCLIIFCSDVRAYFLWMLTFSNIEEVFVLFVSAAFSFPCQCLYSLCPPVGKAWRMTDRATVPPVGKATGIKTVLGSPNILPSRSSPALTPFRPTCCLAPQCYQKGKRDHISF